jgi:hypothetical protein
MMNEGENMDELVEFLRARLDEDECVARAAAQEGASWVSDVRYGSVIAEDASDLAVFPVVYDEGRPLSEQAEHIARHDPARALREVAAKRALIECYEAHRGWYKDEPDVRHFEAMAALGLAVRYAALPYAGYEDYRQEWDPSA